MPRPRGPWAWIAVGIGILVGGLSPAAAQTFRPFTPLKVLETAKFDLIYPEASRRTALALATFVDEDYRRLSARFGIEVAGRIPVTITPATDEFNGSFTFFPYPHIVLFDTPLSLEWTSFDDGLEKLFFHELTHAVTLSTRGGFPAFLAGVFGTWATPAVLTAPEFMVEGSAVSLESQSGTGRAHDPLVRERVRQMIRENRFYTPYQASGAWDGLRAADPWYEAGGLFSTWLQDEEGFEAYAELWRRMGEKTPLDLDWSKSGFFALFAEVYHRSFDQAWADFADSLALRGLRANPEAPLLTSTTRWTALDAAGDRLFAVDGATGEVLVGDPKAGPLGRQRPAEAPRDLAVAPDGSRYLVSGYRYDGALATAVVSEYRTATGAPTGARWTGLWGARYFRDGVVGLGSDLHDNRLVWRDRQGRERVLLVGTSRRVFSAPAPLDDHRIAFLVALDGRRRLGLYDFDTGRAQLLRSDRADDGALWAWARDLRGASGALNLVVNPDDRMYRVARVEVGPGGSWGLRVSTPVWSGGEHAPVGLGGRLVYKAAYVDGDALLPLGPSAWTEGTSPLGAEDWTDATPTPTPAAPVPVPAGERPYLSLAWFQPWRAWVPTPLIDTAAGGLRLDGGGLTTFLADPTDLNALTLSAGWNTRFQTPWATGTWVTQDLGAPLTLHASDLIETFTDTHGAFEARRVGARADLGGGLGGEALRWSLSPRVAFLASAADPGGGAPVARWTPRPGAATFGAGLGLGSEVLRPRDLFFRGWKAEVLGLDDLTSAGPRWEALVQAGVDGGLPLRAAVFGFADPRGASVDGRSTTFGDARFAALAPSEAAGDRPGDLPWALGASVEAQVLTLETQTNLSHLYINRLFATLGARGAWSETAPVGSLVARAGAVVSVAEGMAVGRLAPSVWFASKFGPVGSGSPWAWGAAVTMDW